MAIYEGSNDAPIDEVPRTGTVLWRGQEPSDARPLPRPITPKTESGLVVRTATETVIVRYLLLQ